MLRLFCVNSDEVIFALDVDTVCDVDAIVHSASQLIQQVFTERYKDLSGMFRVEAWLVMELPPSSPPSSPGMARITRRLMADQKFEPFVDLKGIPRDFSEHALADVSKRVASVRSQHAVRWTEWLTA